MREITKEITKEQIVELYVSQELSLLKVREILSLTRSQLDRLLKLYKIEKRGRENSLEDNFPGISKKIKKELKKYYDETMSLKEIAEKLNITHSQLKNFMYANSYESKLVREQEEKYKEAMIKIAEKPKKEPRVEYVNGNRYLNITDLLFD